MQHQISSPPPLFFVYLIVTGTLISYLGSRWKGKFKQRFERCTRLVGLEAGLVYTVFDRSNEIKT